MSALAVPAQQQAPLAPTGTTAPALTRFGRPLLTQESLVEEGQQRQLLMAYVKAHMIVDVDYGVIPGTERKDKAGNPLPTPKTLLKPGAEKLTDLFRCSPEFEIIKQIEDFDRPLFAYTFRCRIVSRETGGSVAEGFGSCSSHESKYRWRNADRACPKCGKNAIKRSKNPPRSNPQGEPGWYCFAKTGGCGANFDNANEPSITSQAVGKVENPDAADVANTVLKIAKKRAHVDAAIALARCSDMFTQDAEDFAPPADSPRKGEVVEAQQAKAPARDEFNAEMKRVGIVWSMVMGAFNGNDGTNYTTATKYSEVRPDLLADYFDHMKTLPTIKPPTNPTTGTPTQPPQGDGSAPPADAPNGSAAGPTNEAPPTDRINSTEIQTMLAKGVAIGMTWAGIRDELGGEVGATHWTIGTKPLEVTRTQYAAICTILDARLKAKPAPQSRAA